LARAIVSSTDFAIPGLCTDPFPGYTIEWRDEPWTHISLVMVMPEGAGSCPVHDRPGGGSVQTPGPRAGQRRRNRPDPLDPLHPQSHSALATAAECRDPVPHGEPGIASPSVCGVKRPRASASRSAERIRRHRRALPQRGLKRNACASGGRAAHRCSLIVVERSPNRTPGDTTMSTTDRRSRWPARAGNGEAAQNNGPAAQPGERFTVTDQTATGQSLRAADPGWHRARDGPQADQDRRSRDFGDGATTPRT